MFCSIAPRSDHPEDSRTNLGYLLVGSHPSNVSVSRLHTSRHLDGYPDIHHGIQAKLRSGIGANNIHPRLTRPYADNTIPASLNHVSVPYSYTLNNRRGLASLLCHYTGAAIPLSALHLIIHFYHVLPGRTDYTPGIKHHACDWVLVSIGIVDGTCSEIPYLYEC